MTFTELKAEATSIIAAAKASGMIVAPEVAEEPTRPPRKRKYKPGTWTRKDVACKYCKAPILNAAPLQVMCNDICRRAQRNLRQRLQYPAGTDKSKARYLRRKEQIAAYKAKITEDARAYRTLKGLPLPTPRSQRRLALDHAKAYRKLMKKKKRKPAK
jgi:hypothetical protein